MQQHRPERSLERRFARGRGLGTMDRVAQPHPSLPDRRFDASLVNAIFVRGLGGRAGPGALAALREAGIDLSRPLQPSYPREAVLDAVAGVARALFPRADVAEAHRRLGAELVRGFTSGWKAKAAVAGARAMGLDRTLSRLLGRHRAPSNFLEIDFRQLGPARYEVLLNLDAPHPEILQGLAEAVLETLGARGAEVRIVDRGPEERLNVQLARG